MKIRVLFLFAITCMLGLAAVAQNTDTPDPNLSGTGFVTQAYAAQPEQQGSAPAPGDSWSRKNPPKTVADASAAPGSPADQTVAVRAASQEPCVEHRSSWFSLRLKMTTAPAGQKVCPLDAGGKFILFAKTTTSPFTFATAGAAAGWSQYQNDDAEWGQGAGGYGQRYAAAYADRATKSFFNKFFYPVIFSQDPRYFRKGEGGTGGRLGHAIGNTFMGHSDSGHHMPNLSLWAGTASTVALENLYHPGNDRGFNPAAKRFGISIGVSMGYDILREFWPNISRALHLSSK